MSTPVYRQQVGQICERVNEDDRYRAKQDVQILRRLERATTTTAQRNALLDGVRRTSARSEQTLSAFNALKAPAVLAGVRRDTQVAWNRNLARVRGYAQRLDAVTTRAQLLAAVRSLPALRPRIAKDGVALRSGLQRLGGAQCDLQTPRVTPAFTLPALPHKTPSGGASVDTPQPQGTAAKPAAGGGGPSLNAPAPDAKKPIPGAETPGASTNTPGATTNTPGPSVAAPSPQGGGSGGATEGGGSGSSGSTAGSGSGESGTTAGSGSGESGTTAGSGSGESGTTAGSGSNQSGTTEGGDSSGNGAGGDGG